MKNSSTNLFERRSRRQNSPIYTFLIEISENVTRWCLKDAYRQVYLAPYLRERITVTSEEKTMGLLAHAGGILLGFLAPLLVLLLKGNDSAVVKRMSTEALNFQLTVLLGYIIGWVLSLLLIGFLLVTIIWIASIIFAIIAAMAVNGGQEYRYPFAIRIVK